MALGWWLCRKGRLTEAGAARLVRWIVMVPSPIVVCLSVWRMDFYRLEPWLLPFLGLFISASTLLPALLYTTRAGLTRPQSGSFLTCAFFSNLGYLGAFTAFALFGEPAYALCMLYLVFFVPCFYTLGFGIAARYGHVRDALGAKALFSDRLRFYPFMGLVVGVLLSLLRVPRPVPLEWLNHMLIPTDTALYLIAIGSQLTFSSPRPWLRACLAMSAIKFLYTPFIAWLLVLVFRLDGLAKLVVLLEAATPVAVSPLVLPLLFGLDRKLANALWLFTTILSIPFLSIYLYLLSAV
jgi:malate permease and related proteins